VTKKTNNFYIIIYYMSDNCTHEKQYILELIKWGKSQLGKANLSELPPYDNLDEYIKQKINTIYNEQPISRGKKKKKQKYTRNRNKKSKKNK